MPRYTHLIKVGVNATRVSQLVNNIGSGFIGECTSIISTFLPLDQVPTHVSIAIYYIATIYHMTWLVTS